MRVGALIIIVNLRVLRTNDKLGAIISDHEFEGTLELGVVVTLESRQLFG